MKSITLIVAAVPSVEYKLLAVVNHTAAACYHRSTGRIRRDKLSTVLCGEIDFVECVDVLRAITASKKVGNLAVTGVSHVVQTAWEGAV